MPPYEKNNGQPQAREAQVPPNLRRQDVITYIHFRMLFVQKQKLHVYAQHAVCLVTAALQLPFLA